VMNERKVPFLGDIPWLGWFFRFQSKVSEKLNLLVFLTPHLIRDEIDVVDLNRRKAQESNVVQRQNRIDEPTGAQRQILEQLMPKTVPPADTPPEAAEPTEAPVPQP